ncbi:MAG: C69 family dipeptidase [Sedimentisphaerales bacterium]|nr:C69 family dipeptidase [Sedimentisphaerales bacterium]
MKYFIYLICGLTCLCTGPTKVIACTNILVTKGASTDGSTMLSYTYDCEVHPNLRYVRAADHHPESSVEKIPIYRTLNGQVKQAPHTYAIIGTSSDNSLDGGLGLINEHQLVICETTFYGRSELINPQGQLRYPHLMTLALQRAKTARQAIGVMAEMVDKYGYCSSGESFSIADTKEVWILEMVGPGPNAQGAIWVALKVPDGYVCVHANRARIAQFPMNDPENCLYSNNVISFAVEKGFYDPDSAVPFSFTDAYCPELPKHRRYADLRVWSVLRRLAPSQNFSDDYIRRVDGAPPYPLWIKPDKKVSVADMFSLMRDHYEGTDYDMTIGIDAGPFGTPNRFKPTKWTVDNTDYTWNRPISTFHTAFSIVSQSRDFLPDPLGGLIWYSVDDTYTSCYTPLYCGINNIPNCHVVGSRDKFSWEFSWWVFNFVANFANLRYSDMIKDIQPLQKHIESNLLALQPTVEKTALELASSDPNLMTDYLNDYCVTQAELTVSRWKELGEFLIAKYNDGYVRDQNNIPQKAGYPQTWLKKLLELQPDKFRIPTEPNN